MSEVSEIDDDVFEYEGGGMKQCISGFGRNATEGLYESCDDKDVRKSVAYHVDELVRWCQNFNRETQLLNRQLAAQQREIERLREEQAYFMRDIYEFGCVEVVEASGPDEHRIAYGFIWQRICILKDAIKHNCRAAITPAAEEGQ